MKIQVLNWNDYVRSDLKRPSWFCFPVDLFQDPKYMGRLGPDTFTAFAYVCSMALKEKGRMEVIAPHMCAFTGLTMERFNAALTILEEFQLIAVTRSAAEQPTAVPRSTEGTGQEGQEGREMFPAIAGPTVPEVVPSILEPASEETRTYDREHESVLANQKPEELPRLALLWNLRRNPLLPEVRLCSPSRRKHAANRWKEHPSEEFWIEVLERVNASAFCLGKNNRGWKADFDFLMRPDTAAKVLEGKYDNAGGPGGKNPSTPKLSYWARTQGGTNV